MNTLRVACVQSSAGADWKKNWRTAQKALEGAVRKRAQLIAFPEFFYWRGPSEDMGETAAASKIILKETQSFSRKNKCAVLLGSLLEPSPERGKYFNTSYLISEKGTVSAKYRKIHLFDIQLKDVQARESKTIASGRQVVTGKVWGVKCGLSVCYDLRFPELYRKQVKAGAKILFVPANFTFTTGAAHWEVLLRARAIENQAYVIAPGQTGTHPSTGIRSFGTSMIIDPWGRVLAQASVNKTGMIAANLRFPQQDRLQRSFPALRHARLL